MARHRVLITAPYFVPEVERFLPRFEEHGIEPVVREVEERADEATLLEVIEGIDGVICGDDRFTRRVLERADRLEVIAKWGTGIDSIDLEACEDHGVVVCNTPDAFSHPVADSIVGYVLAFARSIPWMDRAMKAGSWEKKPGRSLAESTVGIVGIGNVGTRVAERLRPFRARLLGNDVRSIEEDVLSRTGLHMVDLETLLAEADFVALCCDLNPTSRHLIDEEALSRMKREAVLVNAARGPIVDEAALVAALREGHIGGAGLDVFEEEPLPAESPFRSMDRVLLAPHNANSSPRAWEQVHESTFEQLVRELEQHDER